MTQQSLALSASARQDGSHNHQQLRATGFIPAVVYGKGIPARSITLSQVEFSKIFAQAGEASIIDLTIDGKETLKTLVYDTQRDALTGAYTHADLYIVNMSESIHVEVPLVFVGEAPAVKYGGGTLVKSLDAVEINCLPSALVQHIDVDISTLANFDDTIKVSDIVLPEGVTIEQGGDVVVATVQAPRSDAEMNALNEAVVAAPVEVEVVGKKEKKEEEVAQ